MEPDTLHKLAAHPTMADEMSQNETDAYREAINDVEEIIRLRIRDLKDLHETAVDRGHYDSASTIQAKRRELLDLITEDEELEQLD